MITKKYKTPLYRTGFTIILYEKGSEILELLKDFNQSTEEGLDRYDGCVFSHKDHLYLILNISRKGFPTPGIVAHESKHLVNFIYHEIGMDLCILNDEPEAYLLGWIVDEVHDFLNKERK